MCFDFPTKGVMKFRAGEILPYQIITKTEKSLLAVWINSCIPFFQTSFLYEPV